MRYFPNLWGLRALPACIVMHGIVKHRNSHVKSICTGLGQHMTRESHLGTQQNMIPGIANIRVS